MRVVGIDMGVTSKHCAVVVESEALKDSKPIMFGTSIQEYGVVNTFPDTC